MRLTDFIAEPRIKVPLEGETKDQVLRELAALVCQGGDEATLAAVIQSVMERERIMSTGIGQGIALPHGWSPSPMVLTAALGIAARPLDFDSIDGQPARIVFLLVSDEDHVDAKMRALARISRLLHREDFRRALAAAPSPARALRVIVDEEARHRV